MRQCRVEIPKRKLKGSHREFVETDAPARPEIPSTKKEERRTMNTKSVANFRCAVFLKLWFLILLLGISGCVSTSFRKPPPPYSGANAFQKVYVYSFVDIREKEIGPNFMVELERAFGEALTQSGVTSEQLWFLKSPYAADYSLQQTPTGAQKGTTRVPVREVIVANQKAESVFGPSHRMIIFPASITTGGSGPTYDFRWDIMDVKSGHLDWTATSSTIVTNFAKADENPVERAKLMVKGIVDEMRKAGVLRN